VDGPARHALPVLGTTERVLVVAVPLIATVQGVVAVQLVAVRLSHAALTALVTDRPLIALRQVVEVAAVVFQVEQLRLALVIVRAEEVLRVFLLRCGAVPVAAAVVGVRPPARPRLRAVERPLRRRAVLLRGRRARRCPAVLIIISDRATRVTCL